MTLDIIKYSEKSHALFGDSRKIKDELKKNGCKFNPSLTNPNTKEKEAGWIFSEKHVDKITNIVLSAQSDDTINETKKILIKNVTNNDDEMTKKLKTLSIQELSIICSFMADYSLKRYKSKTMMIKKIKENFSDFDQVMNYLYA